MPHSIPEEDRDYQQDQRDHRQDRRDDQHASAASISANTARIDGLERWQVAQNGSLRRMEDKLDKLQSSATDKFDKIQASSTEKFDKLEASSSDRFAELQKWMMGAMFTALVALAGIVVTLLRSKP